MADSNGQDRTEKATPKKREEAAEKGNVPKSTELNSVAVLIAAIAAFKMTGESLGETLKSFLVYIYMDSSQIAISAETIPELVSLVFSTAYKIIGPIILTILAAGLAINYAQVGFMIAKKALEPDFKKISPMAGVKRLFSARSLFETAKGIVKILIVATIGFLVITKHQNEYILLANMTIGEIISFLFAVISELVIKVSIALLIMAIADYAYQKWEHEKNLKMTKQEVRDETKQQEGDQKVKGKIRGIQLQNARNRMMTAVPEATVVVTNPTYIAIALKYEPEKSSDAPTVVAKGKRKVAEKIREIAKKNGIPVMENKPLARSLYDVVEVGHEIPPLYYQAVAEIIARIFQAKKSGQPLN